MSKGDNIIMFEEYGDMLTVDEVAEILGIGKTQLMKSSAAARCIASCLKVDGKFPNRF